MKKILIILGADLKRRMKSPMSVILMMCIPLAMTLVIGLVFGRSGSVEIPRIKTLLVDNDRNLVSRFITQGLRQDRMAELLEITEVSLEEGRQLMADGKASAMLEIPEGFTEKILDREPTSIIVTRNPSETFKPLIVEEVAATFATLLDNGSAAFSGPVGRLRDIFEAEEWPSLSDMQVMLDEARGSYALTRAYISDSIITMDSETLTGKEEGKTGGDTRGFNIFAYVMSGALMIGLLFISNIMLRDIVREKETGTMARVLSAPVSTGQLVAGKVLAAYMVTLLACVLLLGVSRLIFRIDLGDPAALSLHLIATMAMCTGLMTFCFGLIRRERAADAITSVLIIVLALLGGSMISVEAMGETLRGIARISPVFWANDGFRKIFLESATTGDLAWHLLILSGLGVVTIIPGAFLLGVSMRRGG